MRLPGRLRVLLEDIARNPQSRILAFRVSTDPRTGEVVLACIFEYFAGVDYPTGPWHRLPIQLLRGGDWGELSALAKELAEQHRVGIDEQP
jgi:hypothetical protein